MVARQRLMRIVTAVCLCACWAQSAAAQPLGTFRWQAEPFCNVIALSVVQVGTLFTLDGFDDQCGAATRASVVGTAFFNLDGSVGIGLTTIATPGGTPVHIDVALNVATLGGPWRDSAGNAGTFVFTPGSGTGGTPRPLGRGIGASAIDPTQVQRRVSGTCATGALVRAINEDGTLLCDLGDNTAVGRQALKSNTTGSHNVATGVDALSFNTTGASNTAVGLWALRGNTSGFLNTAVGANAGDHPAGVSYNTFLGAFAKLGPASLMNATAVGARARVDASNAMVLGSIAGVNGAAANVKVGIGTTEPLAPLHVVGINGASGEIQVGSYEPWSVGQSRIIAFGEGRFVTVGEEGANNHLVLQGSMGVRFRASGGTTVGPSSDDFLFLGASANRWKAVYAVDGTINTSDARLKTNIANLDYGLASLLRLRPVSFAWRSDEEARTHLGLLAQDVEQIIPEAVVHGATPDEPLGMNYSTLIPVLIKAIQEQQARIVALERRLQSHVTAR